MSASAVRASIIEGLIRALRADAGVGAFVGTGAAARIFTEPDGSEPTPYIRIADISEEAVATDSGMLSEAFAGIACIVKSDEDETVVRLEAERMVDAVRLALHHTQLASGDGTPGPVVDISYQDSAVRQSPKDPHEWTGTVLFELAISGED